MYDIFLKEQRDKSHYRMLPSRPIYLELEELQMSTISRHNMIINNENPSTRYHENNAKELTIPKILGPEIKKNGR